MDVLAGIVAGIFWALKSIILALVRFTVLCVMSLQEYYGRWSMSFKSMKSKGFLTNLSKQKKIFVYGAQHAGKTTFIASMFEHLSKSKTYLARRDGTTNAEGVKLIRKFRRKLREGSFPGSTQDGYFEKIDFDLTHRATNAKRNYSIHEIAGETAIKLDPTHDEHASVSQELKESLMNSAGMLIVASSTPENTSDLLDEVDSVYEFLELLERYQYNRPILFLLTKYDIVSSQYESSVHAAQEIYTDAVNLLHEMPKSSILDFSVGEVEAQNESDGTETYRIVSVSDGSKIEEFIEWMETL
jgi:GTPase SAR1 family protein